MSTAAPATTSTSEASREPRPIDLRPLLAPRSIAVVGASPRSDLARTVRDNIATVGGAASCYFVNPRYEEVNGSRCYPDLAALPEVPDVVLIGTNPLRAPALVREAAAAGVGGVVIPGGGVVEGGEAAARMQAEVAEVAVEAGIALVGPNCMGLIDLTVPSATYIDDLPVLTRGRTAAIAQSGSVTDAFVHAGTRIGWSRIVSCGAEAVLDLCDYLALCIDDPETDSILLFVEGFKRPEHFLGLADRALELGKSIVAVKVGRSDQAQRAAVAHTGSLAGDARATDAALRAAGVIRCDDLDELIETAALIDRSRRLGRRVGQGRTGVVTVSTGEGSLIADLAPRLGLELPPVPPSARDAIQEALPTLGLIANPLDPWGAGEGGPTYRTCLDAFADSGAYDVLALVHDFPFRSQPGEVALATELASELVGATAEHPDVLPVFVSLTSGDVTPEVETLLDEAGGVPVLRGTSTSFGAIPRVAWWEFRHAARVRAGPVRAAWPSLARQVPRWGHDVRAGTAQRPGRPGPHVVVPERESLELLRAAGLPVIESVAVEGRDAGAMAAEATSVADRLGWPVAVKLDAPGLAHKSDAGGVVLDVRNRRQLESALRRVLAAGRDHEPDGVLIQTMAPAGVELIVGARRDPQFGPIVMVGIGGVFAEVLDDVVLRLAPIDASHARQMLDELRGARLLDGIRGRRGVDRSAIGEVIAALGRALEANPSWREVDLNPVIAGPRPHGAVAVDALIVTDVRDPDWDYEDPGGGADG